MKIFLRILKLLGIVSFALMLLVLGLNYWIIESTNDRIYYKVSNVPGQNVGLILGTSKRTIKGTTNKYFKERIDAAAALYHQGKIRHLIVSGDNNTVYYNEPRDMYTALVGMGIKKEDITLDFAGFRTFDSVVRSKFVFGQDDMIIITQDFHCYRALFIADYYGINAIAYSADNKDKLPVSLAIREVFARVNAIFDLYVLRTLPKFLGKKEPLPID